MSTVHEYVSAGQYRKAADKQTEKEEKLKNIGAAAVGMASGRGMHLPAVSAPVMSMAELSNESSAVPSAVSLKGVVMLSLGIASSVPKKGKGKTKGKPNKGNGKDGGKDAQREKCKAMYVGQEGRVLCIVAFGSNVDTGFPDSMLDGLVDVCNVRPKLGERTTLVWDGSSKLIKHLRPHMDHSVRFEYDCSTVCDDFGTIAHAQGKDNGAMVALVMKVTSLEELESSNGEPYLVVRGRSKVKGVFAGPLV